MKPVLSVSNLDVSFFTDKGELAVVRHVDLEVYPGETVALVGESGCGKTVTAMAIMGLLESSGKILNGDIVLGGEHLLSLSQTDYQALRGRRIGMIFQEPMTSLNPVFTIGDQIAEVLSRHTEMTTAEIEREVVSLLDKVGIPAPEQRRHQYPHELSGGMKQRVMIAMALACKPDLLIADEPTTALDVTIQAQILQLLKELQREMGMAILLITHNLGVVAHFADRVQVMYAGDIVETGDVNTLFNNSRHPYTHALIAALPRPGHRDERLASIPGNVPAPYDFPVGCRFITRCPDRTDKCSERPALLPLEGEHKVACWIVSRSGEVK